MPFGVACEPLITIVTPLKNTRPENLARALQPHTKNNLLGNIPRKAIYLRRPTAPGIKIT
jgi:hypothetical protein